MSDILTTLIQRLDENTGKFSRLDRYYTGQPPLAFLAPEAKEALGNRFGVLGSNLCRLAVTALSERLRVTGFTGADVWADWIRNDLDQLAPVAHREALTLGSAFVIVWADEQGRPTITVEDARQVAVIRDPASREIVAGVKRWTDATHTHAVLYGPDTIVRYRAQGTDAASGYAVMETLENPLGVVPVVELVNTDRLNAPGMSEMRDLLPLQDSLNKLLADLMVGSEYYARPRRWATGVELVEDEDGEVANPFPENNRMMISEDPASKFGSLPAADLSAYDAAIKVVVQQMQALSGLPDHYVGISASQPPSADALRAAEASLTARAEQRQQIFGRAWEQVARLVVAVRTGVDPSTVDVRITWADPATRSIAQEADAVVKLYTAGLLPATYALKRLGYGDDEIAEIRAASRTEAVDRAAAGLVGQVAA
ncbi:phage portal protein [Brachybacterium huguangmaarense]|uniref:Phage portal protein n=1 Tax=Brachybacterium huguangmaarense TaxID=1652028 RepID=A0ABY6FXJ2_9MICO|nr:phage portal protein [Brachybacterium huguangmaarense]UYG15635.1 phage portal protein [Brachybacterium huguangmaarense]